METSSNSSGSTRVMKFLPTAIAFVFNLEVSGEDLSFSTRWALQPETSENRLSRIAFFVNRHGIIRFSRVCLG